MNFYAVHLSGPKKHERVQKKGIFMGTVRFLVLRVFAGREMIFLKPETAFT